MEAKEFIIGKIEEFNITFPKFIFTYGFDELSHSHFLEVSPKSSYDTNANFNDVEFDLYLEFLEEYPYESLVIYAGENDYSFAEVGRYKGIDVLEHTDVKEYNQLYELFSGYDIQPIININLKNRISNNFYTSFVKSFKSTLNEDLLINHISTKVAFVASELNDCEGDIGIGINDYALAA